MKRTLDRSHNDNKKKPPNREVLHKFKEIKNNILRKLA